MTSLDNSQERTHMLSYDFSLLDNVVNSILFPCVCKAYEIGDWNWKSSHIHDAIPKLMAPTHCFHFGGTQLCVATCRLVGYHPSFVATSLKMMMVKMKTNYKQRFSAPELQLPQDDSFLWRKKKEWERYWQPYIHTWEPWPTPTGIPLD